MNEHAQALLSWAGPGLFSLLGMMLVLGMRAVVKGLERILSDNAKAHERMMDQLGKHEMAIAGHELRLMDHGREHRILREGAEAMRADLRAHNERITRIEERERLCNKLHKPV